MVFQILAPVACWCCRSFRNFLNGHVTCSMQDAQARRTSAARQHGAIGGLTRL